MRLFSVLNSVVISGEDVCCIVVFGTLVGVPVFSVMWSELMMTSAISCPLWSSVYVCQRVECAFTSPVRTECGMLVDVIKLKECKSDGNAGVWYGRGVVAVSAGHE